MHPSVMKIILSLRKSALTYQSGYKGKILHTLILIIVNLLAEIQVPIVLPVQTLRISIVESLASVSTQNSSVTVILNVATARMRILILKDAMKNTLKTGLWRNTRQRNAKASSMQAWIFTQLHVMERRNVETGRTSQAVVRVTNLK